MDSESSGSSNDSASNLNDRDEDIIGRGVLGGVQGGGRGAVH